MVVMRVLFMVLMLMVSPAGASNFVVKLSTHNLFPYSYYDDGAPMPYKADETFKGLAVDVVRCAFDKMNQPFEIYVTPWARAQHLAKKGEVDGFFAASQKDSRDKFAVISNVVAQQKWQWFWLKGQLMNINHPQFMEEGTIGGFRGANMLNWAEDVGYKRSVVTDDMEGLIQAFLKGRMDVMIANKAVAEALLAKKNQLKNVVSQTAMNKPLSVYFTKEFLQDKPDFMDHFNRGVLACRPAD